MPSDGGEVVAASGHGVDRALGRKHTAEQDDEGPAGGGGAPASAGRHQQAPPVVTESAKVSAPLSTSAAITPSCSTIRAAQSPDT